MLHYLARGLFFIIYGVALLVSSIIIIRKSDTKEQLNINSRSIMKKKRHRVSWIGIIKLLVSFVCILIEKFLEKKWKICVNCNEYVHFYIFCGLSGLTDILSNNFRFLSPMIGHLMMLIPYLLQILIIQFDSILDNQIQFKLLYWILFGCFISTIGKTIVPYNVIVNLSLSFFLLLQGSWHFQINYNDLHKNNLQFSIIPSNSMNYSNQIGHHMDHQIGHQMDHMPSEMHHSLYFAIHIYFHCILICLVSIICGRRKIKIIPTIENIHEQETLINNNNKEEFHDCNFEI